MVDTIQSTKQPPHSILARKVLISIPQVFVQRMDGDCRKSVSQMQAKKTQGFHVNQLNFTKVATPRSNLHFLTLHKLQVLVQPPSNLTVNFQDFLAQFLNQFLVNFRIHYIVLVLIPEQISVIQFSVQFSSSFQVCASLDST